VHAISARQRERQYRVLASLYLRPPSEALVQVLGDAGVPPAGSAASVGELEAEHTALFVLPSGVIPHEAFYLDREQRLGGRTTIAVEQFYRRAGMPLSDRCIEMADHLGLELEFMAALCRLEAELETAGDSAGREQCVAIQRAFFEEHLARWAPLCCERVIAQAESPFYQNIARYTTDFLQAEQAHLGATHPDGAGRCEPAQRC
jgi:TorA maturation chaperone TorD